MINFKVVRWKNFLSTGNEFTEVYLDKESTTLIIGENGSGKSTILDALCFGLYGKPFRNINKPQLINSVNERNLEVEVEFEIAGKDIKVFRSIKPNNFEIYVQDKLITQDAALRDYQQYLEQQILKLNYRSFTQVVILGSSTFVPFMQLSAKDRREVVEDILDIRIFTLMNSILKIKSKTLQESIQQNENQIQLTEEKIRLQEKYIQNVLDNKENLIDEKHQKILINKKLIVEKEEKKQTVLQRFSALRETLENKKTTLSRITKLQTTFAALENKYKDENKTLAFFDDNTVCPTFTQEIDEELRQKKIKEKHDKVHEIGDALNDLKRLESEEKVKIKEFERFIYRYEKEIESFEHNQVNDEDKERLQELKTELKFLEKNKLKLNEDN